MNIKSEPHITLVITLTDDEARDIIVDPSDSGLSVYGTKAPAKRKPRGKSTTKRGKS